MTEKKLWEEIDPLVIPGIRSEKTGKPKGSISLRAFHHFDNVKVFTEEEIKAANERETLRNEAALEKILADGFIEIPITFRNVKGELVEKRAWVHPTFVPSNTPGFFDKYGMKYNIYVPSYKRAKDNPTASMLTEFGVKNWYFAIDPDQYETYAKYWPKEHIIIRDITFRDPSMVDLGTSVRRPNTFSGTAGIYNNLLSFSRSLGEKKYWTLDDDFLALAMKIKKGTEDMKPGEVYDKDNYYRCSRIREEYGFNYQKFMNIIERYSDATRNHGFVGLERFGTVFSICIKFKTGTRVYSYYLSNNQTQQAHKYAMNNDVIASMEQSRRGLPPVLIEDISYNSMATQSDEGGLSSQYKFLGTLEKGKLLVKAEPNFAKISERFSRIHHTCDFTTYNKIRLVGAPLDDNAPLYYKSGD